MALVVRQIYCTLIFLDDKKGKIKNKRSSILYYNVEMVTFWQDMFAAGTDTMSTALEWTMAELISNPKEMKKVQEEVRNVISTIEKMTYLNAAIKETLRLHPPVPLLVPREVTRYRFNGLPNSRNPT
jgi:Cytochrome P450